MIKFNRYKINLNEYSNSISEPFILLVPENVSINDINAWLKHTGLLYDTVNRGLAGYKFSIDDLELMRMISDVRSRRVIAVLEFLRLNNGWKWEYSHDVNTVIYF